MPKQPDKTMHGKVTSREGKASILFIEFLCLSFLLIIFLPQARSEPFQLITTSATSFGIPNGGDNDSLSPVMSADGRYVIFASSANNLVLGGASNAMPTLALPKMNVFLRDRTNGTTTLVSVNVTGSGGGSADSFPMDVSTNGQFVLFESSASNLVSGDSNSLSDVFLRDMVNGTNILISASVSVSFPTGVSGNAASRNSVMTPDGRFVAFVSSALNLTTNIFTGPDDRIFLRDTQLATTTLETPGVSGGLGCELPDITPDGRYIAFFSYSTGLVAGVTTTGEIYVRDTVAGVTTCVSGYAHNAVLAADGNSNTICFNHVISDNGQYVAYEAGVATAPSSSVVLRYNVSTGYTDVIYTNAVGVTLGSELSHHFLDMTPDGNFVAFVAKTNSNSAVYVWNAQTGISILASGDTNNNIPASSVCDFPVLDSSGRYVSFMFTGSGLVTNSNLGGPHVYLRDMQAGVTTMVDADTNGIGSALNPLTFPRLSADGSQVAFEAYGTTLVTNNPNHYSDVYACTVTNGAMDLISARQPALPANELTGISTLSLFSVSANARYFAFTSDATNAVSNDTNGFRDVFEHDLVTGSNFLASVDTNGIYSGNGISMDAAISDSGRYVAFTSWASNLVAGDTNNVSDVFVRDFQLGTNLLVSVNTSGYGPGNGPSYFPALSVDGRYVLFHSWASNLTAAGYGTDAIYWRDLQSNTTVFLSKSASSSNVAAMTPDGRYVVVGGTNSGLFIWDMHITNKIYTNTSTAISAVGIGAGGMRAAFATSGSAGRVFAVNLASNTVANLGATPSNSHAGLQFSANAQFMVYAAADANKTNQIYVYDFQALTNRVVSQNSTLTGGGNGNSDSPVISPDGRFIAYRSVAKNIVPGVTNGLPGIFLYDRVNDVTSLATVSLFGNFPAAGRSLTPVFSGDSSTLVIESWASDLVPQDFNQWSDVFALSLYATNPPIPFVVAISQPLFGQPHSLAWPAVAGRSYQVQYKLNLNDPVWQVLNGNITILGGVATVTDSGTDTSRYYRVVEF